MRSRSWPIRSPTPVAAVEAVERVEQDGDVLVTLEATEAFTGVEDGPLLSRSAESRKPKADIQRPEEAKNRG